MVNRPCTEHSKTMVMQIYRAMQTSATHRRETRRRASGTSKDQGWDISRQRILSTTTRGNAEFQNDGERRQSSTEPVEMR
jgi:hypothetical protein